MTRVVEMMKVIDLGRDRCEPYVVRHAVIVVVDDLFEDHHLREEEEVLFARRKFSRERYVTVRINLPTIANAESPQVEERLVFLVQKWMQVRLRPSKALAVEPPPNTAQPDLLPGDLQAVEVDRF